MSLFRNEHAALNRLTLEAQLAPVPVPSPANGSVNWYDLAQQTTYSRENGITLAGDKIVSVNSTPVTLTNQTSSAGALMAGFAFPAQSLNKVGKTFTLTASGTYNLGAASTNIFVVTLGSVTLGTFTSGSNANTGVTLPWNLYLAGVVTSTGATGTVEVNGQFNINIGATAPVALTGYGVSAVSSAVDLTASETLSVGAYLGSGNASSTQIQRMQIITLGN